MRAGRLDRIIIIERRQDGVDEFRNPLSAWVPLATVRAEMRSKPASGISADAVTTFRLRYIEGVALSDRVNVDGRLFDIREVIEISRRRGLEIRAIIRGDEDAR